MERDTKTEQQKNMFQTKKKHISGFTLVELSIVMAIIGILIGGVLKGREMIINGQVTATVTQIHAVEAAVTTFRDTYSQIPGDMLNAAQRVPGCNILCNPVAVTGGNGVLGGVDSALLNNAVTLTMPLPGGEGNETTLFWTHLALTDLLGGITDSAIRGDNIADWGETHPVAKIGGGFLAGHLGGSPLTVSGAGGGGGGGPPSSPTPIVPGRPAGATDLLPLGVVMVLRSTIVGDVNADPGIQALSPRRAAQIDLKMDDGNPATGIVQSYGVSTSCYRDLDGSGFHFTYAEELSNKDCGLMFQIQG